ncbi:MAG: hypothetical protein R3E08_04435 [Thiotrichaceae bacterium]
MTHEKSVEAADRRFARLEEQFAKPMPNLQKLTLNKRIGEMVGGIANNQGQVAEEFLS